MRAASLFCLLLFCAGAAQSQSVFLQYTDPSGEPFPVELLPIVGEAFEGAPFEVELWIDFPAGAAFSERGGVNVFYDSVLTSLNQIDPILPPCPATGPDPCVVPGIDNGAGTISGFLIEAPPSPPVLQGRHHVATLIFTALDEGVAEFVVEEDPAQPFFAPVDFNGVSILIVLPTCQSASLPQNFHPPDPLPIGYLPGDLPGDWESIFVNAEPDSDGDGVADQSDNCLLVANPTQCDTDGDSYGNHCDADFDNSCFVNFLDLGIMKRDFFMSGALDTDLNCDGITNFLDLAIMRDGFFQPPGPSGLPTASCNPRHTRGVPGGWHTTEGDYCDFTGDNVGDNVTGGLEQAACLETFAGGLGDGEALCTTAALDLFGAMDPVLELHANFQPAVSGGFFQVIGGTDPPTAANLPSYDVLYETDAPLGGFRSLPGESLVINLPSVNSLHVCVLVSGKFDYAQVDHCIACALQCGSGPAASPTRNPGCGVERR